MSDIWLSRLAAAKAMAGSRGRCRFLYTPA
jgi:hypothetical protein